MTSLEAQEHDKRTNNCFSNNFLVNKFSVIEDAIEMLKNSNLDVLGVIATLLVVAMTTLGVVIAVIMILNRSG